MEKEEAFLCPFCGAPYRELIPAGTVQVKCRYCGATVFVPPRLGGAVKRCPNHPESLAVGLCSRCGESYCDRCLYVVSGRGGTSYLCSKCLEKNHEQVAMIGAIFGGFLIFMSLIRSSNQSSPLIIIGLIGGLLMIVFGFFKPHYPTISEKMKTEKSGSTRKSKEL